MANNIVKSTDMTGFYDLSFNSIDNVDFFDKIAFDTERKVLAGDGRCNYGFMGEEEYIKLIADLIDGVPQTAKYLELMNGCNYVNQSGRMTIFDGIKEMLKGFVFRAYLQSVYLFSNSMGTMKPNFDGGERATMAEACRLGNSAQNIGVNLYNGSCFYYLDFKKADYPNYLHTHAPKFILNGIF